MKTKFEREVDENSIAKAFTTREDNERVSAEVGKFICFKSDVEQQSIVKEIRWNRNKHQLRVDITTGEHKENDVWIDLKDCWN